VGKRHSQTGEHRGKDESANQAKVEHLLPEEHRRGEGKSGHKNKPSKQGTHFLKSAEGRMCQDMKPTEREAHTT